MDHSIKSRLPIFHETRITRITRINNGSGRLSGRNAGHRPAFRVEPIAAPLGRRKRRATASICAIGAISVL